MFFLMFSSTGCAPWLQCKALFSQLILHRWAQRLLHDLSPVWSVQSLDIASDLIWNSYSLLSLDREDSQDDCNLEFAFSNSLGICNFQKNLYFSAAVRDIVVILLITSNNIQWQYPPWYSIPRNQIFCAVLLVLVYFIAILVFRRI